MNTEPNWKSLAAQYSAERESNAMMALRYKAIAERLAEALQLAQEWLANSMPMIEPSNARPLPLPVIAKALAAYTAAKDADAGDVAHPFLSQMTQEIQANARKGDWNSWWPSTIEIDHEIRHHTAKLLAVIKTGDRAKIREFSADIANVAHRAFEIFG